MLEKNLFRKQGMHFGNRLLPFAASGLRNAMHNNAMSSSKCAQSADDDDDVVDKWLKFREWQQLNEARNT